MKSVQISNVVLVAVLTVVTSALARSQPGTPSDNNDVKNVPHFENIHVPYKKSDGLADALKRAGLDVKLDTLKNSNLNEPGYDAPEVRQHLADFFESKRKNDEKKAQPGIAPAKPRVLVTISKETTFITGPLRKDGYPDYVAALNERFKKNATAETDSAVPFWKAIGPEGLATEELPQYYKMLNMPPLPQRGNYFVSTDTWERKHPGREFSREFDRAIQRPWSKDECPEMSKWLKANETPLNLLIQASNRPTRYDPILSGDPRGGSLEYLTMCAERMSNNAAWALVRRCMMRLQEGNVDEAWEDLLTCHRLGRLVDKGPFLEDTCIESRISSLAFVGEKAMFCRSAVDAKKLKRMQVEFAKARPAFNLADKVNFYGRFRFLDSFCQCARTQFYSMGQLFYHEYTQDRGIEDEIDAQAQKSLDYDIIFKVGNSWFDRLVSAAKQPSRREQLRDIDVIEKEVESRAEDARDALSWHLEVNRGDARREVSKRIAVFYIRRLVHDLRTVLSDGDQTTAHFDLVSAAFALAIYRADNGAFPEKLNELIPKYVANIPGDMYADDAPLHYKRQGAGYLLYSVGPNGKDDAGRGYPEYDAGKPCDDIVIRVP